jgi:hypothetical protein
MKLLVHCSGDPEASVPSYTMHIDLAGAEMDAEERADFKEAALKLLSEFDLIYDTVNAHFEDECVECGRELPSGAAGLEECPVCKKFYDDYAKQETKKHWLYEWERMREQQEMDRLFGGSAA